MVKSRHPVHKLFSERLNKNDPSIPSLCILGYLPFGFALTESLGLLLFLQLFLSLAHKRRGLSVKGVSGY